MFFTPSTLCNLRICLIQALNAYWRWKTSLSFRLKMENWHCDMNWSLFLLVETKTLNSKMLSLINSFMLIKVQVQLRMPDRYYTASLQITIFFLLEENLPGLLIPKNKNKNYLVSWPRTLFESEWIHIHLYLACTFKLHSDIAN